MRISCQLSCQTAFGGVGGGGVWRHPFGRGGGSVHWQTPDFLFLF